MNPLPLTRLGLLPAPARSRDDRGDGLGWVLGTVRSATIVAALTVVAQDELARLLRQALNQVQ